MKYVGIDIAKNFDIACVLDEDNSLITRNYRINSEFTDFDMFYRMLESIDQDKSQFLIGMEATGLLFENLYLFLKNLGYSVVLLNPYQTTKFREMDTMKYVKNDNIDSQMIAALLKSGRYAKGFVSEDIYQAIKSLYRHKATLTQEMKNAKRQVSTSLAVVFPEFERIMKDPFSVSGMALLEKYPTAKHYKGASPQRILKVFRNIKGNNFNLQKAGELYDLATTTIYQGNAKDERAYVILSNLRRIRFLKEEIEQCESQMFTLLNESEQAVSISISKEDEVYIADLVDNLRSIDGVSDKTIFAVLSECGDIARFKSGQSFIGFLGLYPTLHQSGNTTRYGRLAKRGAKLAKMAIYQAAVACVRHNAELKKVYLDKKSSGRAPKECIVVVARKLAMIIYSIYKNNTPYNPARVFSTQASLSH
ncbi:Mobile element protein [hydrothermal vent metagenome]|uniref:Mobile element protein n=1 Tax=hydrothermal vent metagenome TaxID=652676 RepID=A0A1W1CW62_9ZZZZ